VFSFISTIKVNNLAKIQIHYRSFNVFISPNYMLPMF